MTQQEYEKARQECWDALHKKLLKDEIQWQPVNRKEIVNFVFDRAYAIGRGKETITQEDVEKAAKKYAAEVDKNVRDLYGIEEQPASLTFGECAAESFREGVKFALGKQEKDAEGEEMLTVPRKKVQEMFTVCNDDAIQNKLAGYPDYALWEQMKCDLLKHLFGSKCLPDEACNVASNVASTEPKPAEPENEGTRQEQCVPKNAESGTRSFDNILKDGFRNERRLNIAAMAMQGLLANTALYEHKVKEWLMCKSNDNPIQFIPMLALKYADALISEANKQTE